MAISLLLPQSRPGLALRRHPAQSEPINGEVDMSLQKRLSTIEARLRALEAWKGHVEDLVEDEEQQPPERTLDGQEAYGERDQNEPL